MPVRHLIYHVYPLKTNDVWRRNVRELLKRWPVFTGRKLIGVALDEATESIDEVKREFNSDTAEFYAITNSRVKRDGLSLEHLLPKVVHEPGVTFFAQTKGVSTMCSQRGAGRWRNLMYRELLDDIDKIDGLLTTHACVGTHRNMIRGNHLDFPSGEKTKWHFAGGFWWVNNADLAVMDWRRPLTQNNTGWLAETYLPLLFDVADSACVAVDDWKDNVYDAANYSEHYDDDDPLPEAGFCLDNMPRKLNLGCGADVRPGWINVDLDRRADVHVDLAAVGRGELQLPFDDDSIDYVLMSHTLEHIYPYHGILHEICRVSRMPGVVDIAVPHYGHQMAMCQGHLHVVSPIQVDHWCKTAVPYWFGGQRKRLHLENTQRVPTPYFPLAKKLYPNHRDEDLYAFVPNTCQEIRYRFIVGLNTDAPQATDAILNTGNGTFNAKRKSESMLKKLIDVHARWIRAGLEKACYVAEFMPMALAAQSAPRGTILECGSFRGYSTAMLATIAKECNLPFVCADSFQGLPQNCDGQIDPVDGSEYKAGMYACDLETVKSNVALGAPGCPVEYLPGWFSESLVNWNKPISLLWMDVDLGSSVRDILNNVGKSLATGAVIFAHECWPETIDDNTGQIVSGPEVWTAIREWLGNREYTARFLCDHTGLVFIC